jgi:hypothetical protein
MPVETDLILVDTEQFDNGRVIATIAEHTGQGPVALNPFLRPTTSSADIVVVHTKSTEATAEEINSLETSGLLEG